ncbi:hypothetical protein Scep_019050 [Stephania cephalantha]|uniref:Uncharacterized protein n=1 Tax=Stephania cephalantha TaxID=152367 RepID=A0AAP0I9Z3_9MAGN
MPPHFPLEYVQTPRTPLLVNASSLFASHDTRIPSFFIILRFDIPPALLLFQETIIIELLQSPFCPELCSLHSIPVVVFPSQLPFPFHIMLKPTSSSLITIPH